MVAYVFTLVGLLVAAGIYSLVYPMSAVPIRYAVTIGAFATLLIFFFGQLEGPRLNRFLGSFVALAVLIVSGFLILGVFQPFFAAVLLATIFIAAFAVNNQYPNLIPWTRARTRNPIGFTAQSSGSVTAQSKDISDMFGRVMAGLAMCLCRL